MYNNKTKIVLNLKKTTYFYKIPIFESIKQVVGLSTCVWSFIMVVVEFYRSNRILDKLLLK